MPLNLYFKEGRVKVTLGLARGKKLHDKRAAMVERVATREAIETVRERRRRAPTPG